MVWNNLTFVDIINKSRKIYEDKLVDLHPIVRLTLKLYTEEYNVYIASNKY